MHSSLYSKDIEKQFEQLFIEISCLTKYEIIKLFQYNSDRNFFILKSEYNIGSIECKGSFYISSDMKNELSNNFFNLVLKEKKIVRYSKGSELKSNKLKPYIKDINNELYIPLQSTDKSIIGCLYLGSFFNNTINNYEKGMNDQIENKLLQIYSMYEMFYRNNRELEEFLNIIQVLSEIVRIKNPFMVTHPYNVAQWAMAIAKEINLERDKLLNLYYASVLHDIGKLFISEKILNKPSSLTKEEHDIIKKHTVYGYNIINSLPKYGDKLGHIAKIVRYHHERFDGEGYPDGLKKEEIPLESRIIAVADAVDAMLSVYSYNKPKSLDTTIKELLSNKGKQFDPDIVDIMVNILLITKKIQESSLDSPIIWSTLVMTMNSGIYNIEGVLSKQGTGYVFKSNTFDFLQINKAAIREISLYIKDKKDVIEYSITLDFIDCCNNQVFISALAIKPMNNTFTMLWDLKGKVQLENKNEEEINIYKIGGNCLSFTIDNFQTEIGIYDKSLILKIVFEDETCEIISGEIMNSFRISNISYYDIKYINIPDFINDRIFRQLFKKQMELRRLTNMK